MKILVNGAAGRMGTVLRAMIEEGKSGAQLAGAVDALDKSGAFLPSLDDF